MVKHHVFGSISQREAPFSTASGLVGSLCLVSQKSISGAGCVLESIELLHLLISVDGSPEAKLHGGLIYSQGGDGQVSWFVTLHQVALVLTVPSRLEEEAWWIYI